MGQQQLLLILLGTIIAGIAIVAAINVYSTTQRQAAVEGLKQEAFVLATGAKAWYSRPDDEDTATKQEGAGTQAARVAPGEPTWKQIGAGAAALDSSGRYPTPWGTISKSTSGDGRVALTLRLESGETVGEVTFTPGTDPPVQFDTEVNGAPP